MCDLKNKTNEQTDPNRSKLQIQKTNRWLPEGLRGGGSKKKIGEVDYKV